LAFATDGTPYVAYTDASSGILNKVVVKKHNGSAWVDVGSASGISASTANYICMAVNLVNTPYVAYQDGSVGGKATVLRFNGTNWVTVGSAGFSAGAANYTSIAFASDGTLYIVYQDVANGNKATVKVFNGSSWVDKGTPDFSAGAASYTTIKISIDNNPVVAYQDAANGNRVTVKKIIGSSWTTIGLGVSAGSATDLSLAIANDGTNFIAYSDGYAWAQQLNNIVCTGPNTWVGSVSTAWENGTNWSCGIVPDSNTDVIISIGSPNDPIINSNVTVKSVTANTGANLTVNPGFRLDITGSSN
jgi:hypothetical protein